MEQSHARYMVFISLFVLTAAWPQKAAAHCDGIDGPVVQAAQRALATGNANAVLIWIKPADEAAIKDAFAKTLAVRKLNPAAKELADRYFFETLVRVHRAGEGAAYTGLKKAGRDLGPAIPAADQAIETGSAEQLVKLITSESAEGIRERFHAVVARKNFSSADVNAGREYVKAYVEFLHYVEGIHGAIKGGSDLHAEDPDRHPTEH
jgi:hypothetical protein